MPGKGCSKGKYPAKTVKTIKKVPRKSKGKKLPRLAGRTA